MNDAYAVLIGLSVNHLLIIPSASPFVSLSRDETRSGGRDEFLAGFSKNNKERGKKLHNTKKRNNDAMSSFTYECLVI